LGSHKKGLRGIDRIRNSCEHGERKGGEVGGFGVRRSTASNGLTSNPEVKSTGEIGKYPVPSPASRKSGERGGGHVRSRKKSKDIENPRYGWRLI